MKYMVELSVGIQQGNEIEGKPGGPGPIISRVLETFKPESVFMACSQRKMFMIVDLPNESDTAALMIVGARFGGEYPKFTPVIAGKDFGPIVGAAIQKADKVLGK